MMTVIFIDMVDNCLLSKSSDKDVHSPFARSFKSRSFIYRAQGFGSNLRDVCSSLFQVVIVFLKIECNSLLACDIRSINGNDRGNIPIILFLLLNNKTQWNKYSK